MKTRRKTVDVEGPRYVQIQMKEFQALTPGTITLVRSAAVPYLGDHFFMVTGPLVQKSHGLRPQGISIKAGRYEWSVLDQYKPINGVIALRLTDKCDIAMFTKTHRLSDILL